MGAFTKRLIKYLLGSVFLRLKIWKIFHRGHILVLTYHRVVSEKDVKKRILEPGIFVKKETFEKHIAFFSSNYKVISFEKFINEKLNPSENYCIITFDDGWKDNYINAYPVLKKFKTNATVFLACGYVNTDRIFWTDCIAYALQDHKSLDIPDRKIRDLFLEIIKAENLKKKNELFSKVIENLKDFPHKKILKLKESLEKDIKKERLFLSWDEIKEMSSYGIYFGSHGINHIPLPELSENELLKEIRGSKEILEKKEINFYPVFSYPYGRYNFKIKQILKKEGYLAAVTTESGLNKIKKIDNFAIKRINIHEDISSNLPLLCFHIMKR